MEAKNELGELWDNELREDVESLKLRMAKAVPGFEVRLKADSWIQRAIGFLLRPFNDGYMTRYATTMFGKVWMPSGAQGWSPWATYQLLRHEFIHLLDARRYPILFHLSYIFLLPSVFTFRAFWEMRAFTQTMLAEYEYTGTVQDGTLDWIEGEFTSGRYLWMLPFRKLVRSWLTSIRSRILSGEISGFMYPHSFRAK